MSLVSALTVLFVILKVFNIVTWSWWLVFTPLIAGIIFSLLCFILSIALLAWRDWD